MYVYYYGIVYAISNIITIAATKGKATSNVLKVILEQLRSTIVFSQSRC